MKRLILPFFVIPHCLITSCDKPQSGKLKQLVADLEAQAEAAEKRAMETEQTLNDARLEKKELERQLEEQQIAVERDALERERALIEEKRAEMARLQDEREAIAEAELLQREALLEEKEQSLETRQSSLNTQQQLLDQKADDLSRRDQQMAGREAMGDFENDPGPDFTVNSVEHFYDTLSPYGSWFDSPEYGYVWRPAAAHSIGWRPYTRGRWSCTDRGWMWLSDEPFGWATYHYGRWARCRTNGWLWVPGTEWAPSWVCWRSGGSHIGWAPLPPETLAYRGRAWDSTVEVTFGIGSSWFCFVEARNFCRPIYTHCIPVTRHGQFWGNTTNITHIHTRNNRVICGGPRYGDVQRQTRTRPPFYRIEEARTRKPGKVVVHPKPYVRNGRVAVTKPRREESRNPDAKLNRPTRISGRFERIDIDRKHPVNPRIISDFRRGQRLDTRSGDIATKQKNNEKRDKRRGEEQRKLVEHAQNLEKDMRRTDDRIRVLPRKFEATAKTSKPKLPAGVTRGTNGKSNDRDRLVASNRGNSNKQANNQAQVLPRRFDSRNSSNPGNSNGNRASQNRVQVLPRAFDSQRNITQSKSRGEEQRRLVEHAEALEDEMRLTDDRVRVLPRVANRNPSSKQSRSSFGKPTTRQQNNKNSSTRVEQQRNQEAARQNEIAQAQRRQLEAAQRARTQQQQRQQQAAERQRLESKRRAEETRQRTLRAAAESARLRQQAAQQNARRAAAQQSTRNQQRIQQPARFNQQRSAVGQNSGFQRQPQMRQQQQRVEQPRRFTRQNR